MPKLVFNYVSVFFIFYLSLNAQSVEKLVENVKEKYSLISDFKADFIGTISNGTEGRSQRLSGKISFKKVNKFRVDLTRRVILSNGETTWNFDRKMKRVVISNPDKDFNQFSPEFYINEYSAKSSFELVGEQDGVKVIKFTPTDSGLQFKFVILWINSNNLIEKIEAKDSLGGEIEFTLSNIIIDSEINDDSFIFSQTEEVKVIDLR